MTHHNGYQDTESMTPHPRDARDDCIPIKSDRGVQIFPGTITNACGGRQGAPQVRLQVQDHPLEGAYAFRGVIERRSNDEIGLTVATRRLISNPIEHRSKEPFDVDPPGPALDLDRLAIHSLAHGGRVILKSRQEEPKHRVSISNSA